MTSNQEAKTYRALPTPIRITEQRWPEDVIPLVSIYCTTYNHEFYIRDCIEGFLMQETTFPVEILIHDDASTDRTADIVREFEARYPWLIKPIYQPENQFSKNRRPFEFLDQLSRGKYIAVCEGDDFWTDKNKLEIQVQFLEANPEYVISGHDAYIVDEDGNRIKESKLPDRHKRDYTGDDLICGRAFILTMSRVYRNVLVEEIPERRMVINGDRFAMSLLGHYGKSKYHSDIKTACYRVHAGGVWSMLSKKRQRESLANTMYWLHRYYKRIGNDVCARFYWDEYLIWKSPFKWLRLARRIVGQIKMKLR